MKVSRLLSCSIFLAVLVFISAGCLASERSVSIKIIHLNDLHGHILPTLDKTTSPPSMTGGAAYLGAMLLKEKSANPDGSVLLAAGDMFQGTPISNVFRGKPIIDIMNYLGFDAMELGNHEFDWEWPELQKIVAHSRFPYLAANLRKKNGSAAPGIKRFIYLKKNGIKIAVIGIITPETSFSTNPKNVKDFMFQRPEKVLPGLIAGARRDGAKLVIVLSHCGLDRDRSIAENVPGIDVIVGGHSHTSITPPVIAGHGEGTIIVQAGSWGKYLGVLDLELDEASGRILKYSHNNLKAVSAGPGSPFDKITDGIIQEYREKIKNEFSRVVGETKTELVRSQDSESNLGNLICDAMRKETGAQAAFYNSGGIRANIFRGKIRLEQAFEALPLDNAIVSMDLTGKDILEILERSAAREFGIMQVSGIIVKVNPDNPRGSRVVEALVSNTGLDPEKTYRVATNEFLAAGGDRYSSFRQGRNIVFGENVRDVFVRHLERNSPVSPRVEGRITIVK